MTPPRLAFTTALLATLTLPLVAHADPSAADKETARGLMATGRKDRAKGDLQGALRAFLAADADRAKELALSLTGAGVGRGVVRVKGPVGGAAVMAAEPG